jgi:polysaccharide biosynthesis/export protein
MTWTTRPALRLFPRAGAVMLLAALTGTQAAAGQDPLGTPSPARSAAGAPVSAPVAAGYVIGPEDVLDIQFWKEKDLSGEVVVRPDGKISTPLLNDVQAAGLTPDELRTRLVAEASKILETPAATVIVKQINSRKAFVVGEVQKPGPYSIASPTTVLQLLATAGGLREYAKGDRILVLRNENGAQLRLKFDYDKVLSGKGLAQNIELRPGDTVVVP